MANQRAPTVPQPALDDILAQLHQAIATVAVVSRSLASLELPEVAQDHTVLLAAVEALTAAYDALDRATFEARARRP